MDDRFFNNLLEEKKEEGNDRDVAEIKKAIQVIKNYEEGTKKCLD
nr:MAG TPA: hypothetical protein [Caudoviricetes sp.]